jgi:hypothetical protein
MFKKLYKVSWIKIEEMGFDGKGYYCQKGLSKERAEWLAKSLNTEINTEIKIERDK